jgi:alanine racemase
VHHAAQIEMLAAHKTHVPHHVFLKLNSGMNRLGFAPEALHAAWLRLSGLTQVGDITLMTHLAEADAGIDRELTPATERQLAAFEAASAELGADRSLCNSAATLRHAAERAELRGDWIRPGIMLYGSSPDFPAASIDDWKLQPAMTLAAQIIAVQSLRPGDAIGYGGCYTAERAMRIGVVACGYADGYPRMAACDNARGAPVLIDGVRSRIVGRVSMDMITVDLGPVPAAGVGSTVTLWGRAAEGAVLSIDEVADAAGTLGYELMCALAARVPTRVD